MKHAFYRIAVKNNWLFTDKEAEKRLQTGEYMIYSDYGIDKKFIIYIPYIHMHIIPILNK
jgi:hypothetical protein